MKDFSFVCEGAPTPKGRPRFTARRGFVQAYTPTETENAEKKIREKSSAAMKNSGNLEPTKLPVKISVNFFLPIPKSFSKKKTEECLSGVVMPTSRPDLDNYLKLILDAMNGVVYVDDSQIVELLATKIYSGYACTVVNISKY